MEGTKYQIVGFSDDGEEVNETFTLPSGVPSRPTFLYLYAIRALWEARWTPGSIAWKVISSDGVPTEIGENYNT